MKAAVRPNSRPRRRPRHAARGMVLILALLALVGLALSAVVLVRSVDAGGQIVGNLGFKQQATAAADPMAEEALAWLLAAQATDLAALHASQPEAGYYASSLDDLDPTGSQPGALARVDWDGDDCGGADITCLPARAATPVGPHTGQWVITRLCRIEGEPQPSSTQTCASAAGNLEAEVCKGRLDYETLGSAGLGQGGMVRGCGLAPLSPYYRIIVRSVGGRGTVSYTETLVSLS